RASDSAALLRSALADLRETPFDIRYQLYLVWLAEVLGASRQIAGALAAIEEALDRAERTEECWYLPEILRIRGELLLGSGAANCATQARACFARSLELAGSQNVLSWELRTSMSLLRSRAAEADGGEQRDLLRATLSRFSEGFETADLLVAKHLLSDPDT